MASISNAIIGIFDNLDLSFIPAAEAAEPSFSTSLVHDASAAWAHEPSPSYAPFFFSGTTLTPGMNGKLAVEEGVFKWQHLNGETTHFITGKVPAESAGLSFINFNANNGFDKEWSGRTTLSKGSFLGLDTVSWTSASQAFLDDPAPQSVKGSISRASGFSVTDLKNALPRAWAQVQNWVSPHFGVAPVSVQSFDAEPDRYIGFGLSYPAVNLSRLGGREILNESQAIRPTASWILHHPALQTQFVEARSE